MEAMTTKKNRGKNREKIALCTLFLSVHNMLGQFFYISSFFSYTPSDEGIETWSRLSDVCPRSKLVSPGNPPHVNALLSNRL